ncbi:MAG TPA: BTAD domain-containing putative transcriptional regulator [Candidatus Limnocylindria bacterium]|nr:BTAD domain-containing putative transcriptional regulator [Candidatus Limnocylindria bacterium]
MDFCVLGRLDVLANGIDLAPTRPHERAVLAALLLRVGRGVGIDELSDVLWGDRPPPTSRTVLHGLVSSLRRRLGAERLATQPPGYRLRLLPGDTLDLDRLSSAVAEAGGEPPAVRSELLREALELVRGELLADVEFAAAPSGDLAIELTSERARAADLCLAAEEQRAAADLDLGRHADVIPRLEHFVGEEPLREGLRLLLMLALYRSGRQADALRHARDVRRILATELGVEPGPELGRLEVQILDHDPALQGPRGLPSNGGHDLPSGVLTFLATADAGGPASWLDVTGRHGGIEVAAPGGFQAVAFTRARDAAGAAAAIQRARSDRPLPRVGLHAATVTPVGDRYVGPDLDTVRRIALVAHTGQVVMSRAARDLLREAPQGEADVLELGEHRLSDLAPARPLYQLVAPGLAVEFPPLRGLEGRNTNLPVVATPLLGRERELGQVVASLREPGTRLVTLAGPGGTGKTRLAVHAAAEMLDDAPDGVFFVTLEALAQPNLVGAAIAAAAGIHEAGGETSLGGLARELAARRVLLVLDNFEHLLPAARLVGEILAVAPGVRVLATSRAPLKVPGEKVIAVPPLQTPAANAGSRPDDVAVLSGIGSIALFTARARAVDPGFSLTAANAPVVAALCRALDGLPLAIELAANRAGLLSPESLLGRLDRPLRLLAASRRPGPERHRALAVTIDWSHELLAPGDRRLFADLAIFAGGWTLEAAERVAEDGIDVIDGLANLVDQSLVRLAVADRDPRFGMLETIREFAAARLDGSGLRADLERRHAAYFLSVAESAEPHLRGNPGAWIAGLEVDIDNFRAALDRLGAQGDAGAETQASLAGALWRFWYLAGRLSEGRVRLEAALAAHDGRTPARARVLIGAAVMAVNAEDPAAARHRAAEGLALHRTLGDAWGAAYCQFMLGAAARSEDDDQTALEMYEAALAAFRELADDHTALLASRGLAGTLEDLGDRDGARSLYQDNLRRARADRNGRLEASSLGALATIAFDDGRVADAVVMLRESLRIHRDLGDRLDTAVDLAKAARTLALAGRPAEAARIVWALDAVRDELGARRRTIGELIEFTLDIVRRQLSDEELQAARQDGEALRIDAALGLALDALTHSA